MKSKIYCKTTSKGKQSFYLLHEGKEHFLFSQNFRRSVKSYYSNGATMNEALNNPRGGENYALRKTMEKLHTYIKYIERENGIMVLKKSNRKANMSSRHKKKDIYGKEKWYDEIAYA